MSLPPQLRVEGVAQAVAQQVQAQHDQADHEGREDELVGIALQTLARGVGQGAEGGHGRLDADADEAQKALGKDGRGDLQGGGDNDDGKAVGDDVLADDAPRSCADAARGEDVFILLDGEDLAADEARHAHPVEKAEHDEETHHAGAELVQKAAGGKAQTLVQHDLQEDDDQHVGQGVDDIHNAHHNEIDLAAEIARDAAVEKADDEHDDAGEKAHGEGNARAVDDADEIVAALLVRAEYVREAAAALVDVLLLELAVGEGGEILRALVAPPVHGEDLLIAVGDDHGGDDDGEDDAREHNDAAHGQGVFEELAHAVLKEGGALAHHVLLALLVLGRGDEHVPGKLREIDLRAERVLFEFLFCHVSLSSQSYLMRGSTSLYSRSQIRFAATISTARKIVVAMMRV